MSVAAALAATDSVDARFSSHPWQITALGYGAANLTYKLRNILHGVLKKVGDAKEMDRFRYQVLGWTSDQGTERKLADCAFATEASYEQLKKIASSVWLEEIPLAGTSARQNYLFPNCLYMPGHLHILQNALEEATKKSTLWGANFEDGLRAVTGVLNSRGLRQRFVAVCMSAATQTERAMFRGAAKQHISWRWEKFGAFA